MTVNLPPELQHFVESQVRAGSFASADEVLQVAVARLRDDQTWAESLDDEDRAAIAEADAEIAAGLDRPWEEVKAELRQKYIGHRD